MLQIHGIKCILVFDGARLEMKKRVEDERRKNRRESILKA
jgi:5'-3' exonuclease